MRGLGLDLLEIDRLERALARRPGRRRYSTVTVFARLRGWSTFNPRVRAMR